MDLATVDKLLMTTRTVQALIGGNIPRYRFMVVIDAAKRTDLPVLYKQVYLEVY